MRPEARVELFSGINDHKAMTIILPQAERGAKEFRIYNSWLEDSQFIELTKTWHSKQTGGNGLFRLQYKLTQVKIRVKEGNSTKQVQLARAA